MGTSDSKIIASKPTADLKPPTAVVTCHEWKLLKIDCPAEGCDSPFGPTHWQHASCGGSTEINSQALIRCAKCQEPYSIIYGRWDCGNHKGNYIKTDKKKLVAAMMVGAAMYGSLGANVWVKALLTSVANLVE